MAVLLTVCEIFLRIELENCHFRPLYYDCRPTININVIYTQCRIKVFRGPRLDTVMGPYPATLPWHHTLPHWRCAGAFQLKSGRLSLTVLEIQGKSGQGAFYSRLRG